MQKKTILIIAGVAVILLVGIGAYMTLRNPQPAIPLAKTTNTKSSLRALLNANQTQECTIYRGTDTIVSGKVYIGGGKLRGDFSTRANGDDAKSHVIAEREIVHAWADGYPAGYKASISGNNNPEIARELEWDCQPWTIDPSLFELPATIPFNDIK